MPLLTHHSRNSVGTGLVPVRFRSCPTRRGLPQDGGPARGRIPQRVPMGGMISYQRMRLAPPALLYTQHGESACNVYPNEDGMKLDVCL